MAYIANKWIEKGKSRKSPSTTLAPAKSPSSIKSPKSTKSSTSTVSTPKLSKYNLIKTLRGVRK